MDDGTQDTELLDELSRLNNELVDAHRELGRRGAELARAVEWKNQLIGMTAHDLRNPIGAISGFAALLRERVNDRLDEREQLMLAQIGHSSQRMLTLVNDLLSLSDLDRGDLALRLARCDLVDVVATAVELARVLAEGKGIEVHLDLAVEELAIVADAGKLDQVVANLLTNAIKFSPAGAGVDVRLEADEREATLRVTDHGVGIPADEHAAIFRPFAKASSEPTAGETSTGLGLAIVQAIVQGHGGTIEVDSAPGSGSTFTVVLPVRHT